MSRIDTKVNEQVLKKRAAKRPALLVRPFPTQKAQLFPPSRLLLWTEGESNSETLTVQTQARFAEIFRVINLIGNQSFMLLSL